jgi:predicted Ser/Thr protein kinase/tetratricopeptide (TPR) repeat protein
LVHAELTHIGRYRVIRSLAQGGMGQVFLAHDPSLEREVALKLLLRDSRQLGLREEARALAALRHPAIVTIYEIFEHDGQDVIAMEYVPGRTLRELLAAGRQRDPVLAICASVAGALRAAHRAGILHRDIKPDNVLVTDSGEVKVVDFGIAHRRTESGRRFSRAVTAPELASAFTATMSVPVGPDTIVEAGTQTVFGTPAYMAPEVLFGEPATEASDIYGLGVVLYECVTGQRPHPATTLVEMIAQVIDAPAPRLDDPLGDLVDRMLAREPAARPSLDEVIARLSRTAPVARRSRLPAVLGVLGVLAVVALGGGAWALARSRTTPSETSSPEPRAAMIAVAPIVVHMPSYGHEPPHPSAIGDVLARGLGELQGARLSGIAASSPDLDAASALAANYLVTGSIDEREGSLHARIAVNVVPTGTPLATIERVAPSPRLAALLDELALATAGALAPAAKLDPGPPRLRAERMLREGRRLLDIGLFTHARAYLEQAVEADPKLADAWYALTLAVGWTAAGPAVEQEVAAVAFELTPPGPRRELVRGIQLSLAARWGEMRAVLEPLDPARTPPGGTPIADGDRRELFYYLGEASWHDGRHAPAFEYFKRSLAVDKEFRPATVHAWQYAVARRDIEAASFYVAAGAADHAWIDFAAGRYAELAERGPVPFRLASELVLGLALSAESRVRVEADTLDGFTHRIALAVDAGEHGRARALFAEAWRLHVPADGPPGVDVQVEIESLGEVVLAAGMIDEARQLVAYLASHARAGDRDVRGHPRLAILAAPLVNDPTLIVRDRANERVRRLADAAEAELARDPARAAAILAELVADPTATWDYPERAALLRTLRAANRPREAKQLCADTLRPAMYRPAFLALRARCRR